MWVALTELKHCLLHGHSLCRSALQVAVEPHHEILRAAIVHIPQTQQQGLRTCALMGSTTALKVPSGSKLGSPRVDFS